VYRENLTCENLGYENIRAPCVLKENPKAPNIGYTALQNRAGRAGHTADNDENPELHKKDTYL
jgi:hypothetical protein